jgi:hypothetical protein
MIEFSKDDAVLIGRYHVMVIEDCEYIILTNPYIQDQSITHKGNCRYCKERLTQICTGVKINNG